MVFVVLIACDEGKITSEEGDFEQLGGKWLLFERGYSPGVGYIVEPVDPKPPQTLTFLSKRRVYSTISGLEAFSHYRLFDDTYQDGTILAFYNHDPGENATLESSAAAYNVSSDDEGTMRLDFRFCFEGCHIALRKLE